MPRTLAATLAAVVIAPLLVACAGPATLDDVESSLEAEVDGLEVSLTIDDELNAEVDAQSVDGIDGEGILAILDDLDDALDDASLDVPDGRRYAVPMYTASRDFVVLHFSDDLDREAREALVQIAGVHDCGSRIVDAEPDTVQVTCHWDGLDAAGFLERAAEVLAMQPASSAFDFELFADVTHSLSSTGPIEEVHVELLGDVASVLRELPPREVRMSIGPVLGLDAWDVSVSVLHEDTAHAALIEPLLDETGLRWRMHVASPDGLTNYEATGP